MDWSQYITTFEQYLQGLKDPNDRCTLKEAWDGDIEYTQHQCRDFIQTQLGRELTEQEYNKMCDVLVTFVAK